MDSDLDPERRHKYTPNFNLKRSRCHRLIWLQMPAGRREPSSRYCQTSPLRSDCSPAANKSRPSTGAAVTGWSVLSPSRVSGFTDEAHWCKCNNDITPDPKPNRRGTCESLSAQNTPEWPGSRPAGLVKIRAMRLAHRPAAVDGIHSDPDYRQEKNNGLRFNARISLSSRSDPWFPLCNEPWARGCDFIPSSCFNLKLQKIWEWNTNPWRQSGTIWLAASSQWDEHTEVSGRL